LVDIFRTASLSGCGSGNRGFKSSKFGRMFRKVFGDTFGAHFHTRVSSPPAGHTSPGSPRPATLRNPPLAARLKRSNPCLNVRLVDRTYWRVTITAIGQKVVVQARLCLRDLGADGGW
jgi:hypothetical protein